MHIVEFVDPIKHHKVLNPKLWEGDRLKNDVRGALMRIAQDFKTYIDVPFKVVDIIIAGGNANYNYTAHSDIDLHLIADFDSVDCDREAAELFDTKRLLYKRDHDIQIRGIPVELYVEDLRQPAVSASYSLVHDRWITHPPETIPEYDDVELARMVEVWHVVIRHAMQTGDLHACRTVLNLLRKYRQLGLKQPAGEFSVPNLVYKSLRNDDTLKGIMILINRLHDQQLSIGK